jgi:hypothetical protein
MLLVTDVIAFDAVPGVGFGNVSANRAQDREARAVISQPQYLLRSDAVVRLRQSPATEKALEQLRPPEQPISAGT